MGAPVDWPWSVHKNRANLGLGLSEVPADYVRKLDGFEETGRFCRGGNEPFCFFLNVRQETNSHIIHGIGIFSIFTHMNGLFLG